MHLKMLVKYVRQFIKWSRIIKPVSPSKYPLVIGHSFEVSNYPRAITYPSVFIPSFD